MDNKTRYVALGDSYTICEGTSWEKSWPVILTERLSNAGVPIQLVANPSRTGWTTQDLIDNELPVFDSSSPTFATLLIGVNDWVQGVDAETFHKNLNYIIDHVINKISGRRQETDAVTHKLPTAAANSKLVLITIPDFSVTPDGPKYSKGRNIAEGLTAFNKILMSEAEKRKLKCVDIFPISQRMKDNPDLVSKDNLHPSAKEYAIWENLIYPVVYGVLKKQI